MTPCRRGNVASALLRTASAGGPALRLGKNRDVMIEDGLQAITHATPDQAMSAGRFLAPADLI